MSFVIWEKLSKIIAIFQMKTSYDIERETRLGKRLAYLLRYGAEREGLSVSESGG
jgi:RNA:NAD 2'-phosphotransferase (TPT1/KptA family)